MKKTVIGILLIMLFLVGCNKSKTTQENEAVANENTPVVEENTNEDVAETEETPEVGIPNPMQEITDEYEIYGLGHNIRAPKDAKNVKSFLIDGKLFEQQFEYEGYDYTFRVQEADGYEDISGLYYEWTSDSDMMYPVKGAHWLKYESDGEYAETLNWYDDIEKINASISSVSDKEGSSAVLILDKMLPLSIKNRKSEEAKNAAIDGLTTVQNIEDCFNSITSWAGLQSFYDGYQFEELNDGVKLAMAVFCAQTNDTECVTDETGCYQILSEEKIRAAMVDLFGSESEIAADDEICEKSHFEIKSDSSVYVQLGDWGMLGPDLDIPNIEDVPDSDGKYSMGAVYFAHDYEADRVSDAFPEYVCYVKIVPNKDSRYGISIVEMSGKIASSENQ